ncbi:EAL and HDOD domain-containing protein [Salidesulfovibrio onnuriiensis]|uniref:EAL and HDOD domain-containing protein n=1 Tax=Salidesulfovibrio onnuriiensis TaxID=2583823 RepID=UPI0011CBFE6A|nr:HDOD domain-containing protein [Salidesulfovibrio onnuriiensis]
MTTADFDSLGALTYVGRQPIFDAAKKIVGYELLYRASVDDTAAQFSDDHMATLHVIANALFCADRPQSRKRLFVNYSERAIRERMPLAFVPGSVVQIREDMTLDQDFMEALGEIRSANLIIAVDDFSGDEAMDSIYRMADIFIIDMLGADREQSARLTAMAEQHQCSCLAKRVESRAQFQLAREQGFDFFQGFFFKEPEIVLGKRFTTSELSRLNLLEFLKENDPDFDKLARIIEMDPALTYRVLFYINSPYFGLGNKITTIKHAIALLGWQKIKNLLFMIILTDSETGLGNELFMASAVRGFFLKNVAATHTGAGADADDLFILGILSLLDTIFQVPMQEVVKHIALSENFKKQLVKKSGKQYKWLELAIAFEEGNWNDVDALIKELGLDMIQVAKSYYDALNWVNNFYGNIL